MTHAESAFIWAMRNYGLQYLVNARPALHRTARPPSAARHLGCMRCNNLATIRRLKIIFPGGLPPTSSRAKRVAPNDVAALELIPTGFTTAAHKATDAIDLEAIAPSQAMLRRPLNILPWASRRCLSNAGLRFLNSPRTTCARPGTTLKPEVSAPTWPPSPMHSELAHDLTGGAPPMSETLTSATVSLGESRRHAPPVRQPPPPKLWRGIRASNAATPG